MKAIVTGATGFVGSNLVKRLLKDGHKVTAVGVKTESSVPGVDKFLHLHLNGIDWDQIRDHDILFHQAANNDTLDQDVSEMYRANVTAPSELFVKAFHGGCKRFVYASSTAVYGASPAPYKEISTPVAPLNPYGMSKARFDDWAMEFANQNDVSVVGLRYCNVYGPGEDHKGSRASMIHQIIKSMDEGPPKKLFKHGEQKRDWLYVKDAVAANVAAAKSGATGIVNVGSGEATTFNDIFKYIAEYYNAPNLEPEYIDCPFVDAYQNHTECDVSLAKKLIDWEPEYNYKRGIYHMLESQ